MPRYTIIYLDAGGAPLWSDHIERACDDDIIDHVGESTHPHAIDIYDGARHVARCPPWKTSRH